VGLPKHVSWIFHHKEKTFVLVAPNRLVLGGRPDADHEPAVHEPALKRKKELLMYHQA
jgi:hypothetical protein